MRVIFVLTCIISAAWPARGATSLPTDSLTSQEEQGTICVAKDRLAFEQHYLIAGVPEVPTSSCAHEISSYRAKNAAQSACLQGYARHGNGRCYLIVDKPPDGRPVRKHAYRIVYREGCQLGGLEKERKAVNLGVLEALDMCDEDGGCVDAWTSDGKAIIPTTICVAGQTRDAAGTCRKVVELPSRALKSPKRRVAVAENQGPLESEGW